MKETISDKVSAVTVLTSLQEEAKPLMKKLGKIEAIETKDQYNQAMAKMKAVKELGKMAKAKELTITDPLNKVIKDVRELFRPFLSAVSNLEGELKTKMLEFQERQELAEKKLEQDFADGKVKSINSYAKQSAELAMNRSGTRKVWKAVATDVSKTPKAYMVPDTAAITAALKEGKKVAGWELVQEKSIAI